MDMGSRRMQIVGIVLAVLMAALLAVTLWAYRPVSLAEAADALAAFWDGESRGTGDMIRSARRRGLRLLVTRY